MLINPTPPPLRPVKTYLDRCGKCCGMTSHDQATGRCCVCELIQRRAQIVDIRTRGNA